MLPALKNVEFSKYGDGGQFMSVANLCLEAVLASYQWTPVYQWTPSLYTFVRGQGQMLIYVYNMGVHCYFLFCAEIANYGDILS